MKKIITTLAITFAFATVFTSCKKDDDTINNNSNSNISEVVTQGVWKVTLFKENNNDQTSTYAGYQLTFTANGSAAAILGSFVTNGTWSSFTDSGQSKFQLKLGSTPPLDELNSDWHITSSSSTKIVMEDVSGGGSGTDYLTIERI